MRFLLVPAALAASICLPGLAQAAKVKAPKLSWEGEWRLLAEESDKVDALIEEHLKDLNFAMKLLWKRKLQAACKSYPNVDILLGEVFSVSFGKELPADTPTDGTTGEWKRSDGETFQLSMKLEDTRIAQTFQGDGYALTHAYALDKDGQTMTLQVTYANPKRSTPFTYKLAYRKSS